MAQFLSLIIFAAIPLATFAEGTDNRPPTVRIIEPVANVTLYSLSNSVTLRAEASDPDGTITQVKLLQNGTLIASDFQAPYDFIFNPATFGLYTIEVQAVDSAGVTASATRTVEYVRVNDNLGPIAPLSGTNLTLHSSTVEATRQKGEPNHAGVAGGRSVWWVWRPTVTGVVTIDTFGSDFDTVLGVYTNAIPFLTPAPITNLTTVAANDDDSANPPLSRVKFTAFAMQTYYLAVDGRDGFAGNVVLNLRHSRSQAGPNDFLSAATRVFPTSTTTQTGNNIGASKEAGEPQHAGNPGGASMWWRYDGPATPVTISTAGSTFDTLLAVYTNVSILNREVNPPMENLRLMLSNDDAATGTNRTSLLDFTPRPGTIYWVAVDGYNGAQGTIRLTFSHPSQQGPRPTNDLFRNATIVLGTSALLNLNTFFATSEAGEPPQIAPKFGAKSVWYRWVAPTSGPVYLTTKGSDFDTLLGVFIGTNITNLAFVASSDDDGGLATSALTFTASAGTEYQIAIAGFQGAGGDLVLTLNQPSTLAPQLITIFTRGQFILTSPNLGGTFILESSSNLVNWSYFRAMTTDEIILSDAPETGTPQQFYRLRTSP